MNQLKSTEKEKRFQNRNTSVVYHGPEIKIIDDVPEAPIRDPKPPSSVLKAGSDCKFKYLAAQSTLLSLKAKEVSNNSVQRYMEKEMGKKEAGDNRNRYDQSP